MSAPSPAKRRQSNAGFWWFMSGVNALGTLNFVVNDEATLALVTFAAGVACAVCARKGW